MKEDKIKRETQSYFSKEGELVIRNGIALRDLIKNEELFYYGDVF